MTDLPLKDRIALVVGASRGIGYESDAVFQGKL